MKRLNRGRISDERRDAVKAWISEGMTIPEIINAHRRRFNLSIANGTITSIRKDMKGLGGYASDDARLHDAVAVMRSAMRRANIESIVINFNGDVRMTMREQQE